MILVVGGMFQHKLSFVRDKFNVDEKDIIFCGEDIPLGPFEKKVLYGFNGIIKKWFNEGLDAQKAVDDFFKNSKNCVIIADQRGCGVVPIDQNERLLREFEGRVLCGISKISDEVYNVCYGIGKRIK